MNAGWNPNEATTASVSDLVTTLLSRLPYLMGIDELIPGCEITNVDTDGVGVGVIPRYISVRINRYVQAVVYRGQPTINVGDYVNVVHFREGDLYEVLSPGGPSGIWASGGGGGGAPTTAQYVVMDYDATLTAERKLTGTANEIVVTDGGANSPVTLSAGSLIVQTDQVNTFSVGPQTIQTGAAANVGIIITLDASQSVDALQVKSSGGNVLSGIDERGILFSDGDSEFRNFFAGADAGNVAATGYGNVAVGYQAGDAITSGHGGVYIGMGAGTDAQSCSNVVFIGYYAGQDNSSGDYNTGVGGYACRYNQTGVENTAVGFQALQGDITNPNINYNTAVGAYALGNAEAGADENTAVGYSAGGTVTTGTRNIFLGVQAGYRQTTVNDVLLVDNRIRADAATELTHAIIYGVMGANPEDQSLTLNIDSLTIGTDADADITITFAANTSSGVLRWMEDEDQFEFDDTIAIRGQKELRFYDNGNYVGFEAGALSADQIWILPTADGNANEFLQTNGAGTLSWATAGGSLSSTTVTAAGPTDNLDVDGLGIVWIDTSSNDVTIGGMVNGVAGQFLFFAVIDNSNDFTLEHAEGTGNQDMYLYNQSDKTLVKDYGGMVLVCDGSNWYQTGGAGGSW